MSCPPALDIRGRVEWAPRETVGKNLTVIHFEGMTEQGRLIVPQTLVLTSQEAVGMVCKWRSIGLSVEVR